MNIFLIGLPQSGRTTTAKALQSVKLTYFDLLENFNRKFSRLSFPSENDRDSFYHEKFISHLKGEVEYFTKHVNVENSIIDNVISPRDFTTLFDYNNDYVVFLNRIDGDVPVEDYQMIGVSVIRDYCFWLASAGLLPSERWIEYKYRMSDDDTSFTKKLGAKNSVFIVKSFKKMLSHLEETIKKAI